MFALTSSSAKKSWIINIWTLHTHIYIDWDKVFLFLEYTFTNSISYSIVVQSDPVTMPRTMIIKPTVEMITTFLWDRAIFTGAASLEAINSDQYFSLNSFDMRISIHFVYEKIKSITRVFLSYVIRKSKFEICKSFIRHHKMNMLNNIK